MPESVPGFDEMPLYDMPAAPTPDRGPGQASIRQAARRRRLRTRFLRAGREAVDDRELLELLLSRRPSVDDTGALAASLLDTFGTAPRALAARPDRLRSVPGLSEDAIAAIKTAEALGIRMARAEVPRTLRPSLGSYDKVIEYCRALAGHREVEEFHLLYLNRRNLLIADECLQKGSVCHTPVFYEALEVNADHRSLLTAYHAPAFLMGSPVSLARSERLLHRSRCCAHTQLLSGRIPATVCRIRPPIPLAAGTAFRRRGPSIPRHLSARPEIGHTPPGPVPTASGRTGAMRSRDQPSLAPVGTRPVSQNRHSAMSSLRASATIITRRIRPRAPAVRSSNHLLSALFG